MVLGCSNATASILAGLYMLSLLLRRRRGLANLTVITADLVDFQPPSPGSYERVVSIECFEHMKVRLY